MRHLIVLKKSILLAILLFATAQAQLSPGPLSKPHSSLDKLDACKQCHDTNKGVSSDKCLRCHGYLNQRMQQKKGLHANPEYSQCANCHWEHQGRDQTIVLWKNGQEKFDHRLTGYILSDKHTAVRCEKCHKADNINLKDRERMISEKVNVKTTFLGLQPACISCHFDEHRGQESSDCLQCHEMDGWKPAAKFNHRNTTFTLDGKHEAVSCEKCHPTLLDQQSAQKKNYVKLKGILHTACTDCHKDPHQDRLGRTCQTCHSSEGWKSVRFSAFNHDKTAFPLKGQHHRIACGKCHPPGQPLKISNFQRCVDCHEDFHLGQFSRRAGGSGCQECHTEEAFSPSTFTIVRHESSPFPLKGAHRAVPCIFCHTRSNELSKNKTLRFVIKSTACTDCHADPHKGAVTAFMSNEQSCLSCHTINSWHTISFNHNRSNFKLEGQHQKVNCRACHKSLAPSAQANAFNFKGVSQECQDCHVDIHQGQFLHFEKAGTKVTKCIRCHTSRTWKNVPFDHNRFADFHLEGPHVNVACVACHKVETIKDVSTTRYRPIGMQCENCHKIIMETVP